MAEPTLSEQIMDAAAEINCGRAWMKFATCRHRADALEAEVAALRKRAEAAEAGLEWLRMERIIIMKTRWYDAKQGPYHARHWACGSGPIPKLSFYQRLSEATGRQIAPPGGADDAGIPRDA